MEMMAWVPMLIMILDDDSSDDNGDHDEGLRTTIDDAG